MAAWQDSSNMTNEVLLDCPICAKNFKEPKILDCLHSVCLECLQKLPVGRDSESPILTCPVCGSQTKVEEPADLPDHLTLSALVEEGTVKEWLHGHQGSEIRCQTCEKKSPAMWRCMDCDKCLCQECRGAHDQMAAAPHNIYSLAQLHSGEVAYKSKLREYVPYCAKHPDQRADVYCAMCKQLLCGLCAEVDHRDHSHSVETLSEASAKCRRNLAELAGAAEKHRVVFARAADEMTKSLLHLCVMCSNAKRQITKKANKEVARIREEEEKMIERLKGIYSDQCQMFKSTKAAYNKEVIQAGNKLKQVNQIIVQASYCEILNLQQKVLDNIEALTLRQPEKTPDRLSVVEFKEEAGSLGRLVHEEVDLKVKAPSSKESQDRQTDQWKLKRELWTFEPDRSEFTAAWYVAAFSDNEILVADINHKQLVTCMPSPASHSEFYVHFKRLQIEGLADPRHIAVNTQDQIVVLDSPKVKIFNRKYQLLHQFTLGGGSDSQPTCLAVDDRNQIAVGYADKELIYLHNSRGGIVKKLFAPMISSYLTISKQSLIYTNWGKKKLLALDYSGGMACSVHIDNDMPDWGPMGVCCDNQGSIFVAVCGDWPSLGEILHYGPDGRYLGCTVKGYGNLRDITMTPNGDLVIAAVESVKIYQQG
ncbi:uncharacterized protein LOC110982002 [Acanthaster planci]|uniref:Uncharacterized protein LOC110982002 n=1 Tax=Acanthaster planci TaxID=133434 RepID=A0A8B7YTJ5_ACAPL|nr:uncharacterized protein LOC110982002 [Acanthaster planci]